MRIYYCQCGERTEVQTNEVKECSCGKVFGTSGNIFDNINMRTTWSGQTKVEFSQTTMDEDIAERNNR